METVSLTVSGLTQKSMSETHYSLKEMETHMLHQYSVSQLFVVGNPLLSERDGNCDYVVYVIVVFIVVSETHYSLKEMETVQN